jgi:mono/diheme cytochrome c family protein
MVRTTLAWLLVLGTWSFPARAAPEIDFEQDVGAVLVRRCAACHNGSDPKGGLDLSRRATALSGGESQLPAITPNNPENSYLLNRIRAGEMPPAGKGQPVTPAELARLEAWILAGAVWPANRVLSPFELTSQSRAGRDWWSLKKPQRPAVPTVSHADRVRSPIDAFVLAKLEQQDLEPAREADRATFIRRASFDLLGLPPAPKEIEAFVSDTAGDAYEQLVDRLLASPHYGERWARHWFDVVRFAESNGYETNTARANAWPYRDWVIRALNEDLPYPEFVFAQLAGDQRNADAATGFLVGGAHDVVGSPDVELTLQQRMNDLDDMVSTTAAAFLGLSVGCAKCHDHKFDPIAQRDYYALQAIFSGVQHGERELRTPESETSRRRLAELRNQLAEIEARAQAAWIQHQPLSQASILSSTPRRPPVNPLLNVDRFASVRARFVRFTILATNGSEPCLDELEILAADNPPRNLALASLGSRATASSVFDGGGSTLHQIDHLNDGHYGNSHSWISAEAGGGWVQVELTEPAEIDRVVWARDREGTFRDRLATRYKIEVSEAGDQWQTVANGGDRKSFDSRVQSPDPLSTESLPPGVADEVLRLRREAERLRMQAKQMSPQMVYAGNFMTPQPTHLLYRGEPLQRREQVAPGAIAAVGPPLALNPDAPDAERRVALAKWIGDPANPLAARVMVNRIWHYHFGQGLIKTPSDFGFNGGHPSHPDLLDWLATELIAQGWRPKAVHRQIMLSSTYRQASRFDAAAAAQDAAGRLLWRFTPRRLEAEPIRDAILWANGALDLRMGGPGYDVFEPNTNYVKVYLPKQSFGPAEWRRMVYQNKPRMRQDATFGEFDCPDSSQTTARRNTSTTALQALNLLNSSLIMQQAELFAERLERDAGSDRESQVRRAFWLAFGRAPDDDEMNSARRLVAEQGLSVFCRALYNANEFLYLN